MTPIRRPQLLVLAVAAATAASVGLAPVALHAGVRARTITLHAGDFLHVFARTGPSLVTCWVDPTFEVAGTIECYRANPHNVRPRTFSGAIGRDGASVWYYDEGHRGRIVYSTRVGVQAHRSGAGRFGRGYDLHVGDRAVIANSPIRCIDDPGATPVGSVECYWADPSARSGVKNGTRTVFVNSGGVTVFRYATSGAYHQVFSAANPAAGDFPENLDYGPYTYSGHDTGSCGQRWASDRISHTYTLRRERGGIVLHVEDSGHFASLGSKSPGSCDRRTNRLLGPGIGGTYKGVYEYVAPSARVVSTSLSCPSPCDADQFWRSHVKGTRTQSTYDVTYTSEGHGTWHQTRLYRNGKPVQSSTGDITGALTHDPVVEVGVGGAARLAGSTISCRAYVPASGAGAGRPTFDCGERSGARHAGGSYSVDVGRWGLAVYRWDAAGEHRARVRTVANPGAVTGGTSPAGGSRTVVVAEGSWAHLKGSTLYCNASRDFKSHAPVFDCRVFASTAGPNFAPGVSRSWDVEIGAHLVLATQYDVTGAPQMSYRW
jgi:hypothetical protein